MRDAEQEPLADADQAVVGEQADALIHLAAFRNGSST